MVTITIKIRVNENLQAELKEKQRQYKLCLWGHFKESHSLLVLDYPKVKTFLSPCTSVGYILTTFCHFFPWIPEHCSFLLCSALPRESYSYVGPLSGL